MFEDKLIDFKCLVRKEGKGDYKRETEGGRERERERERKG